MNFWHESSSGLWRGSRGQEKDEGTKKAKGKDQCVRMKRKRVNAQMENLLESNGTKSYKPKSAVKRLQMREMASTVSNIQTEYLASWKGWFPIFLEMLCSLPVHIKYMQRHYNPNRACCACFSIITDSAPGCRPLKATGEAKSKTCELSADWRPPTKPSSYCRVRVDPPNQNQRGIQEAARPSGEQLRQKEVDEKEEHQPTSKTSPVPWTTCER